jgi:hypothetical protein
MYEQFLDRHEARGARDVLRIVLRKPAQLARRQHRVDGRARASVQRRGGSVAAPALGDLGAPPVHPRDERAERLAMGVDREHPVHGAREADRSNVITAHAHFCQDVA